jgi:hypothetical protein
MTDMKDFNGDAISVVVPIGGEEVEPQIDIKNIDGTVCLKSTFELQSEPIVICDMPELEVDETSVYLSMSNATSEDQASELANDPEISGFSFQANF